MLGFCTGFKHLAQSFRAIWTDCLSLGNTLGALASLIGFPSALFAVYVFQSELVDLFTRPDISVDLREITLRCAYKFKRDEHYESLLKREKDAFAKICRSSPLGISFSYVIQNEDAIDRELKGIRVEVDIPTFGTQNLGFAYDVEHVVRDGFDSTIRRPWFVKRLTPGVAVTHEALMLVELAEGSLSDIQFGDLLERIRKNEAAFTDKPLSFQLFAQVDGGGEIPLANCTWRFPTEAVHGLIGSEPDNQFQLTGYCKEEA